LHPLILGTRGCHTTPLFFVPVISQNQNLLEEPGGSNINGIASLQQLVWVLAGAQVDTVGFVQPSSSLCRLPRQIPSSSLCVPALGRLPYVGKPAERTRTTPVSAVGSKGPLGEISQECLA